jgi:DNA-binding NarL/FixJ family response regulator
VGTILAASSESFRARLHERLLEAGCEDVLVTDSRQALAKGLQESPEALVVTGGDWASSDSFLHLAVRAGAPAIVLLSLPHRDDGQTLLSSGARGALDEDIPSTVLAAALAAVRSGLIVLDPSLTPNARELPPTPAPAHPVRPLTRREQQILSLIAGGTSNKGIARALGVSSNTVKFHLAAAFEKLDVTTRAEAVAEAIRRGELSL